MCIYFSPFTHISSFCLIPGPVVFWFQMVLVQGFQIKNNFIFIPTPPYRKLNILKNCKYSSLGEGKKATFLQKFHLPKSLQPTFHNLYTSENKLKKKPGLIDQIDHVSWLLWFHRNLLTHSINSLGEINKKTDYLILCCLFPAVHCLPSPLAWTLNGCLTKFFCFQLVSLVLYLYNLLISYGQQKVCCQRSLKQF